MKVKKMQAMLSELFQMSELCHEEDKGNTVDVMLKDALVGLAQGDLGETPRVLPVNRTPGMVAYMLRGN